MKAIIKQTECLSSIQLLLVLVLTCVGVAACSSDDEDDFGNKAKYSFVGKTYINEYTLQNTSWDFQNIIHFSTDSTFTFSSLKLETNEYTATPKEGRFVVGNDGIITFYGVSRYNTHVWSRRVTLYQGKFKDESQSLLQVQRYIEFDTGNSRTDWIDFELR